MDNFPIFSGSAQKGELGIILVSRLFSEKFKWIFRRVHQEYDFGIDGFVDIVNDNNQVTGRSFAVQVKCGDSYFKESKYNEYWYIGDNKHLNYLLNYPVPVIIILVNPNNEEMFWSIFDINETEDYSRGWRMPIPKSQILTLDAKPSLKQLIGEEKDYSDDIDFYRKMNIGLGKADNQFHEITREAVESEDFLWTTKIFDRLLVNSMTARKCQGCIIFIVTGYESDPRELFEIPEVRHYLQELESMPWFFFLDPDPNNAFLNILMWCVCNVQSKKNNMYVDRINVYVDPDDKIEFLNRNFARFDITADKLNLSLKEKQRISKSINEYFS